jgi:hypothetical protein
MQSLQDEIVVSNRSIPFERERIKVKDLHLDPKNPRLQYVLGRQPADSHGQNKLFDLLWEKDQVKALSQSIWQNGGVYEPLIVQRDKEGKLWVREGNCRTASCKHLMEQYPKDERFETVPAMVFDEKLTEEDLAVLLADMHVANKIRWDAYEQAKRIYDLYTTYGKTMDWLSNHLRLSKSRIVQDLDAFRATTEYLQAHPDPNNLPKFAFYQELMRKKDLREQYKNDLSFKQRFDRWITDGKLTASAQVRGLEKIIAMPAAQKALDTEGYDSAYAVIVRDDPALESDLFSAVKAATDQLKKAPASDIHDVKANPQKLIMLRNLSRAIDDLATLAGVKI